MTVNSAVTDTCWSPNYSPGRPGAPTSITIHHWGADGQQHQKVLNYLCNPNRPNPTSAHYVASAGRVTQLVHDYDRAWHAGPSGNPRSIGIECRPEMTPGDFETVASLIAAIRSEWGHLPLVGHSHWMPTACPGRWLPRLPDLSTRADQITSGTTTPQEDDMQITEIYAWRDRDGRNLLDQGYEDRRLALTIQQQVTALTGQVAGLTKALGQLAGSQGLDPQAITRTVSEAVQAGLKDVEITLATKESA